MLINQKPLPEDIDSLNQTIAKGMATPGRLAYTAAAKYADALPLYRQEKIFGRYRIDLSSVTMAGWMFKTGQACEPIMVLFQGVFLCALTCVGKIRYLEDGRLKSDNNAAGNAICPIGVGRKNWLMAGTPDGARVSATLYSLIETAKACVRSRIDTCVFCLSDFFTLQPKPIIRHCFHRRSIRFSLHNF